MTSRPAVSSHHVTVTSHNNHCCSSVCGLPAARPPVSGGCRIFKAGRSLGPSAQLDRWVRAPAGIKGQSLRKMEVWGAAEQFCLGLHDSSQSCLQLCNYLKTRTPPVEALRPVAPSQPLKSACHTTTTPSQPQIKAPTSVTEYLVKLIVI